MVVGAGGEVGAGYGDADKGISLGTREVNGEVILILDDNVSAFEIECRVEDVVGDFAAAEEPGEGERVGRFQGLREFLRDPLRKDRA
jgi:hypothetical protein